MKGADLSWGLDCPHRLPVESNTRKSGAGYFQLASGEGVGRDREGTGLFALDVAMLSEPLTSTRIFCDMFPLKVSRLLALSRH